MERKERIRAWALEAGADRCGFARAEAVEPWAVEAYERWIAEGKHGQMAYCESYAQARRDPRAMWTPAQGQAATIISCAFCYNAGAPGGIVSKYALGDDYHYVIKARLAALCQKIEEEYGGETRVCVDTAPLRERYWAQRAGLGFVGVNNQLIIPGLGSYFFLGEALWTGEVEPDAPCQGDCGGCMACARACPGGALDGRGGCDARRCASYLTIEHRGELPPSARLGGMAYGCDECLKACPHNAQAATASLPEFEPNPRIAGLDKEQIMAMTPSQYKKITAHSAMRRVTLRQLQRNCQWVD